MNKKIKPFFINSNLCTKKEQVKSADAMLKTVAYNTGNSYITYSLIKALFGSTALEINDISNIYEYDFKNQDKDIDFINNECTHVFLILQDQIRIAESYNLLLPYEKIINFVKKLNKPIIIAGLGANSFEGYDKDFHKKLSSNLVTFLKECSNHSEVIGLRGYYTQEVLSKIGINNTKVIGCPSFFETGRDRKISKTQTPNISKFLFTCPYNYKIVGKNNIILQDEAEIIKILFNKKMPSGMDEDVINALNNNQFHIFSDIDKWKTFVSEHSFALGHRVHGAILALNSGVPAVCFNGDSRSQEMCEFLNIPRFPNLVLLEDIRRIYDICDYSRMNSEYNTLYENFINFLTANIAPPPPLQRL